MTDTYSHGDVVIVKFPFVEQAVFKARPAVVISSKVYHHSNRDTLILMAISSKIDGKLDIESEI